MQFSDSIFAVRFGITRQDLESYLGEALSQGGDYADLYFEYLATSSIGIDESMVKSAAQGVSMGVGVRVISGERTGYAYSDDLSPQKIRKAANVAAHIAAAPAKVQKFDLNEGRKHNLYPVLTAPTETAFSERVDLVKRADRAARAYDPRIFQVQAVYADNLRQVLVATSEGRLSVDRQPLARVRVSALARRSGGGGGGGRAAAAQRGGAGAAGRRAAAARPRRRRRTHGPGLFPKRKDAGALRPRSGTGGHRHAGRRGGAGRRDDGGAGARLAGDPAARGGGSRVGGRFQPQGRLGLQRAHGTKGSERTVHRGGRWHDRQPARVAQRGRRRAADQTQRPDRERRTTRLPAGQAFEHAAESGVHGQRAARKLCVHPDAAHDEYVHDGRGERSGRDHPLRAQGTLLRELRRRAGGYHQRQLRLLGVGELLHRGR